VTGLFLIAVGLDSAHLFAPIAMAWGHPGFRRVMLRRRIKFVVIPTAILILAVLIAPLTQHFWPTFRPIIGARVRTQVDWDLINPFTALLALFVVWNLYHFGAQNFGVLRLWRRGRGNRSLQKIGCVGGTTLGMVGVPFVAPILAPISVWTFGLSHWLVAIGLAARVSRWPILFWVAMLLAGIFLTAALWTGIAYGSLLVAMSVVSLRVGLGIVHFLYDRCVWKLSDPQVRATIGRDLLCPASTEPYINTVAEAGRTGSEDV
jgi:hypothetical protein